MPRPSQSKAVNPALFTIGHSTRPIEDFIRMLQAHGVTRLVDVRTIPRSRHNPQFDQANLPGSLKQAGIAYTHMKSLGGLRKTSPDSVNQGWRNLSFRGYADYMQTPEFAEAIDDLIARSKKDTVAIMCAEAVPWRCHRSLVADALLVRKLPTADIQSPTRAQPHKITPFAKVRGKRLTYPPYESVGVLENRVGKRPGKPPKQKAKNQLKQHHPAKKPKKDPPAKRLAAHQPHA